MEIPPVFTKYKNLPLSRRNHQSRRVALLRSTGRGRDAGVAEGRKSLIGRKWDTEESGTSEKKAPCSIAVCGVAS
jgi:hypothetical protein